MSTTPREASKPLRAGNCGTCGRFLTARGECYQCKVVWDGDDSTPFGERPSPKFCGRCNKPIDGKGDHLCPGCRKILSKTLCRQCDTPLYNGYVRLATLKGRHNKFCTSECAHKYERRTR